MCSVFLCEGLYHRKRKCLVVGKNVTHIQNRSTVFFGVSKCANRSIVRARSSVNKWSKYVVLSIYSGAVSKHL